MRTLVAAVAAAGITAVVGGATVALAQPHSATGSTIKLAAHQTSEKSVDVGHKGYGPGDEDVSAARLTSGGTTAGTFDGVCTATLVAKTAGHQLCTQTFRLNKGEVTSTGSVTAGKAGPAPFNWAITGGTGSYAKARGYVHVIPGNKTVHMVMHLTH